MGGGGSQKHFSALLTSLESETKGGGGWPATRAPPPWIHHCTVVVHYNQMYLSYILNKSWLCILSPGSTSFFLLKKEQSGHYHRRPLIHIFTCQGSPIPNGTNDRLFYWMADTSSIDGQRGKQFLFALSVITINIESAIVCASRMKNIMETFFYDYRLPPNAFFTHILYPWSFYTNYATL